MVKHCVNIPWKKGWKWPQGGSSQSVATMPCDDYEANWNRQTDRRTEKTKY